MGIGIFFFSSTRRHARCALVTGVQTCALPISSPRWALSSAARAERTGRTRWTPSRRDGQNAGLPTAGAHLSYREGRFWQPDVTVATVVVDGARLLCVDKHVNGGLVLNPPAAHLEPDESLEPAELRDNREETGWDVSLTAFLDAN